MIKQGDCLELMKEIPDGSVDMILDDVPFGTTDCAFDVRLPFDEMWKEFNRVCKPNAAICLFAASKFLIELAASNLKHYRYKWVWRKTHPQGFLNAKKMPLRCHEDILVFYRALPTYNPQFTKGEPYVHRSFIDESSNNVYSNHKVIKYSEHDGNRYPLDVIKFRQPNPHYFGKPSGELFHPQQKPVPLLEYLIRTYTNEGETVLDATMGSGSTGVACVNTGRKFIGFELEQKFFEIAEKRIGEALAKKAQELF